VSLDLGSDQHVGLRIDAPFRQDPAPKDEVGPTWALWEHEVVELFLVGDGGDYLEIEVGPYGHYLILSLDKPRVISKKLLPAAVTSEISGARWTASVVFSVDLLPEQICRANAFAIHGLGPDRTYLAHSSLPAEKPDFHQPHRFPGLPGPTIAP